MTTLQDRILSVFIDHQTRVLKDSDVMNGLINQGIPCSIEDVRRQVQSLSPALFQMVFNEDRTVVTIRVEPTVKYLFSFIEFRINFFSLSFAKNFLALVVRLQQKHVKNFIYVVVLVIVPKKIAIFHMISREDIIEQLLQNTIVNISIPCCLSNFFGFENLHHEHHILVADVVVIQEGVVVVVIVGVGAGAGAVVLVIRQLPQLLL
jgi:hypothetical protein